MAADVAGCARGRARRRRRARRRPVLGRALRLHRRAAAERAGARRRRRAHEHAQARRLADAERDPAPRRAATGSTRRGSRAPCGSCGRRARRRCSWPRSTPRAASSPCTASSCCTRRSRRSAPRARSCARSTGVELLDQELVGRPGIAAYDPLRIVLDTRGTGCTGMELSDALRQSYDVHAELATQSTIVFVVGMGERPQALLRLAGDVEEAVGAACAGRAPRPSRSTSRPAPPSSRCRRARRSSARPSASRSPTRSGASPASRSPATRRGSRRCCPASASARRSSRYLRETVAAGGAPARRERPGVRHDPCSHGPAAS